MAEATRRSKVDALALLIDQLRHPLAARHAAAGIQTWRAQLNATGRMPVHHSLNDRLVKIVDALHDLAAAEIDNDLMTRQQAAAHLLVSTRTIDRHRTNGRLPDVGSGRGVRFRRADVDALVEAHTP